MAENPRTIKSLEDNAIIECIAERFTSALAPFGDAYYGFVSTGAYVCFKKQLVAFVSFPDQLFYARFNVEQIDSDEADEDIREAAFDLNDLQLASRVERFYRVEVGFSISPNWLERSPAKAETQ